MKRHLHSRRECRRSVGMPRYTYGCDSCNEVYDVLTTTTWGKQDMERCPKCGSVKVGQRFSVTTYAGDFEDFNIKWSKMDAKEREMHLDAKRYYESRAPEILEGRLELDERGPKELRPTVPEGLVKRYY